MSVPVHFLIFFFYFFLLFQVFQFFVIWSLKKIRRPFLTGLGLYKSASISFLNYLTKIFLIGY